MNASDQSDPVDASDFVEPADLASTDSSQESDGDDFVETPREYVTEESTAKPQVPLLRFQVVRQFPEANPDFSVNPLSKLQIGGGKVRKRKKKRISKSLRHKHPLLLPKLESSVDRFHQSPRGNPLGKSYMLVSQGLSRQPVTDDHVEKHSHKKSDLFSPRNSTTVKSDVLNRQNTATMEEESKPDTVQKECTNSTLGNTVSIMSTSNVELLELEGVQVLPTDNPGKCETMKHYLLDLAADEEDWRLWQQLKATPVEAFDFSTPDEQKTYLDADVAENIEALHKKLTLSYDWSHHPCPIAVFGKKSVTFNRRNPLPLSTAMKNGSLKDLKKLAVTQSQLLATGTASPRVSGTAETMAHGVYSLFQFHSVVECLALHFTSSAQGFCPDNQLVNYTQQTHFISC